MAAVNDIYRATFEILFPGGWVAQCTNHYRTVTVGTGDPSALLAASASNVVGAEFRPVICSDMAYNACQVQKIFPLPVLVPAVSVVGNGAGAVAEGTQDFTTSVCITKTTGFAGRAQRGRIYVPGVPPSWREDGQLKAANVADYDTLQDNLWSGIVSGGWTWVACLWHRSSNTFTDLTGAQTRRTLRVQRRRELGKGI